MKTLNELCPKWIRALDTGDADPNDKLNIHDAKYCLVGEAHGFRVTGCETCLNFGICFTDVVRGRRFKNYFESFRILDGKRFNEIKTEFEQHYNEAHLVE